MELIPAIDLRGGRCVRLLQGHFDAETHYPGDPLELARAYHAQGAGRLHIVDLDGARDGTPANLDLISRLAALPGSRCRSAEASARRIGLPHCSRPVSRGW
jgi:phosphoribosylformimino-5-aminoimidazole carboxamide ribotide isomerase